MNRRQLGLLRSFSVFWVLLPQALRHSSKLLGAHNNNALDTGSFIMIRCVGQINKQRTGSREISRPLEQAMDVAAGVIIYRLSYLLATTTIRPPTTKVD